MLHITLFFGNIQFALRAVVSCPDSSHPPAKKTKKNILFSPDFFIRLVEGNLVLRPPTQTLSHSRGEKPTFLYSCEIKSGQEAWAGGLR